MCFYLDYDWTAQVCTDEVGVVTEAEADARPVKCGECGRVIPVGAWSRHIFMQEEEWCRLGPMGDDYEGPETDSDECPEGCEHDFGEEFEYDRCEACEQLIEAIHRHELSVGCLDYESRPALTELYDAMNEGDGEIYLAKAEELFPGIAARLPADRMWFRERAEAVRRDDRAEGE